MDNVAALKGYLHFASHPKKAKHIHPNCAILGGLSLERSLLTEWHHHNKKNEEICSSGYMCTIKGKTWFSLPYKPFHRE